MKSAASELSCLRKCSDSSNPKPLPERGRTTQGKGQTRQDVISSHRRPQRIAQWEAEAENEAYPAIAASPEDWRPGTKREARIQVCSKIQFSVFPQIIDIKLRGKAATKEIDHVRIYSQEPSGVTKKPSEPWEGQLLFCHMQGSQNDGHTPDVILMICVMSTLDQYTIHWEESPSRLSC